MLDVNAEPLKRNTSIRTPVEPTTVVRQTGREEADYYGKMCLIMYVLTLITWIPVALLTKSSL